MFYKDDHKYGLVGNALVLIFDISFLHINMQTILTHGVPL